VAGDADAAEVADLTERLKALAANPAAARTGTARKWAKRHDWRRAIGRFDHLATLRDRVSHRLFAQDMITRPERLDRVLAVQPIRRTDRDHIGFTLKGLQHRFDVGELLCTTGSRNHRGPILVDVTDAHEFAELRCMFSMTLTDASATNDREANTVSGQLRHVWNSLPRSLQLNIRGLKNFVAGDQRGQIASPTSAATNTLVSRH